MPTLVNDVFAEANPTYTLVDRSDTAEYRRIQKELRSGGKIVRLHGPSKSGKTLLCRQVYGDTEPPVVYGSDIEKKEDLWNRVAAKVNVSADDAARYCAAQKRPIIIDDFHWIDRNVQAAIIRSFKPFLDAGGTAILLSVPDVAEVFLDQAKGTSKADPILGDLLAKSVAVHSPGWTEFQIRQIAKKGFPVLNIQMPDWAVAVLAKFSFGNPLLMQKHCSELCFSIGIDEALPKPTSVPVMQGNLVDTFKRVSAVNGVFFQKIVAKGGNRPFTLANGKKVTIRELVLFAITRVNISQKVGLPRIMKNIRECVATGSIMPDKDAIRKAFADLIVEMRKAGQSGLVMDDNSFLYIAHPFFKSFLVWSLVPSCGGALPDLDKYVEPESND